MSPQLGCQFHPRCPRAFEICGWEGRDLKDLLEAHWTRIPEEEYERERELVGDLDAMEVPSPHAVMPAAKGRRAEAVLALLERIRNAEPAEPLWKGVSDMTTEGDHVRVEFHEPTVPLLKPVDDVEVSCHLFTD